MKDWRGVTLATGQLVIYPVQQGSSAAKVVIGELVELAPGDPDGFDAWRRIPDRVRVQVRERMNDTYTSKGETIVYASRVTVILGVPDA